MLDGIINIDVLHLIYRWKWQTLINELNKEYHQTFVYLATHTIRTKQFYKMFIPYSNQTYVRHFPFNYRFLDESFPRWIDIYNFKINKIKIKKEMSIKMSLNIEDIKRLYNYAYTSTTYLREISQRGIKCLKNKDNVR